MQTNFTLAQLADPDYRESETILRACVHCGFCTATCPTYSLLGDELDSPRGRIYQIKSMLEAGGPPTPRQVVHIDRCLSCLSCMTTCPSGVHYMHLVDHARGYIEQHDVRPRADRLRRRALASLLTSPGLFRLALRGGTLARPFARLLPAALRPLLALLPKSLAPRGNSERPGLHGPADQPMKMRVGLLLGCAQRVVAPSINDATIRLLNRHGVGVVIKQQALCCGALNHHLGQEEEAKALARVTIDGWMEEIDGDGLDAVIINTSGCGTVVKDYGHLFRNDPAYAEKARRIAALTRDVTEIMAEIGLLPSVVPTGQAVAYHAACSLQHGQKIKDPPRALLRAAGFAVREVPDGHLCCGSAGTYNMLQPDLARQLGQAKVRNIESTGPNAIVAGNLGCITQIGLGTGLPILHTVELLDWATGGPLPGALRGQPAFGSGLSP